MRTSPLVIDASVLVPLLMPEDGDDDHGALDDALRDGATEVIAPPIIDLEVINIGAHRRHMGERHLVELVRRLDGLPINRLEPRLEDIASWATRGLSSYDACYAALAEEIDARVLTHDGDLLELLPDRAIVEFEVAG